MDAAMWDIEQLADLAGAAMARREGELAREQAVYGLDALDEVDLHPLLAAGFERGGFGVIREQPCPHGGGAAAKRAHRERCDLVLTRAPGLAIADPVAIRKERLAARGSLFERAIAECPAAGVPASEAYWLEVKVIAQYSFERGVPGANAAYGGLLTASLAADLEKLARQTELAREDPEFEGITRAGVLMVLFAQNEEIARHDLTEALHRCVERGLRVRAPALRAVRILDRVGNACVLVGLVPV